MNLLDLYRHRSRPSGCPTLVYLHGGAFRSGRKNREARPLLYRLASQGWVCISANYRLSPAARFPDSPDRRQEGDRLGARARPRVRRRPGGACSWRAARPAVTWPRWPPSRPTTPRSSPGSSTRTPRSPPPSRLYGYYGPTTAATASCPPRRGLRPSGCAAVLRRARRPGHDRARGRRPALRRASCERLVQSGRLRRAARGAAHVRPVPLPPLRGGRRRGSRPSPPGCGRRRRGRAKRRRRPSSRSLGHTPLEVSR